MIRRARHLLADTRAVAAAEMALVAPLLLIIMFGSFELGNYFYDNHIVIKGVRDGARYASRRGFADYDCTAGAPDSAAIDAITNVTRTGQVADGGAPRLANWTDAATVDVTVRCADNSTASYAGIYEGRSTFPVVSVAVDLPYRSLFSDMVFKASTFEIKAESEVPVMGI